MYDLSILVPGIRNDRWERLYDSIDKSCTTKKWELILIGPNPLPDSLKIKDNVKHIQDFGAPTRCRQQGLIKAEGQWVFYAGDDLTFLPNSIDKAFERLEGQDIKDNVVLMGKYTEGERDNPEMLSDDYYKFAYHDSTRAIQQFLPYDAWIIMAGLVPTKLLKKIGGWDCQFNVCAVACLDLSIRLQNYGVDLLIHDEPFFHAEHLPNNEGDHSPIAYSQTYIDMPLLHRIYSTPLAENRINIDINNWKHSSPLWNLRFNG